MIWVVIEQPPLWAGRWELDLEHNDLTIRELGWIKKLSGYLPIEMSQGLAGGDAELFAAYAIIGMVRAGKISNAEVPEVFEQLLDVPYGSAIRIEDDEEAVEDDASPPPFSSSGDTSSSGTGSSESSGSSVDHPNGSGTPGSVSLESVPVSSGTSPQDK